MINDYYNIIKIIIMIMLLLMIVMINKLLNHKKHDNVAAVNDYFNYGNKVTKLN